jgi:hypothetical protein
MDYSDALDVRENKTVCENFVIKYKTKMYTFLEFCFSIDVSFQAPTGKFKYLKLFQKTNTLQYSSTG